MTPAEPSPGEPSETRTEEHRDRLLDRSVKASRLLLVRGAALRAVSVPTAVVLAALVSPSQLGLLAVVRGISGIGQFVASLGFENAMVRRKSETTEDEMAALAGFRMLTFFLMFLLAALLPAPINFLRFVPRELHGWMLVFLATHPMLAYQTGAKVRLERKLDFKDLAIFEVSSVLLQNVGFIVVAALGVFTRGMFVVLILLNLYNTIFLYRISPGNRISLSLRRLRSFAKDSIGFTLGGLFFTARDSGTPLLISRLYGLELAGYWSFAYRFGQVLQLTFEGQARAAFPAAAQLSGDKPRLGRLSTSALRDGARIAYPTTMAIFGAVPLLHQYWPKWSNAVPIVQVYVLAFGVFGVVSGSVLPVIQAIRGGIRGVIPYPGIMLVGTWIGITLLWAFDMRNVAIGFLGGSIAALIWLVRALPDGAQPDWKAAMLRPIGSVVSGLMVYGILRLLNAPLLAVAFLTAAAAAAWVLPEITRVAQRQFRGANS